MKLLFMIKHPGALRLLESSIRGLAAGGHEIHLAFDSIKTGESVRAAELLAAELPGLSFGQGPAAVDHWSRFAQKLRLGIDYLRYLTPAYSHSPKLRRRAEQQAPARFTFFARLPSPLIPLLSKGLARVERSLDPPRKVVEFIRGQAPDVVLVTPLVGLGSRQADYVRAARRLGLRTAFPVLSWDNLTNKGLLRDVPDLVLVWNERQASEAAELHGVPRERIAVTGAAAFDHWFDWEASRTREEFCASIGLDADRPFLLYVCSSPFIAPNEAPFVTSWIERLRASGPELADVGVLVRPHPQNAAQWEQHLLDLPNVAVWPPTGEDPLATAARQNYFDSLHHSAAVVGINTSALIESAIVGRGVHTLLTDEFEGVQEGTLHFRHLSEGLLQVGRSFDEHAEQLRAALAGNGAEARSRSFVESFVRPQGVDLASAPRVVDAIEALGARPAPAPTRPPLERPLVQRLLRRAAWQTHMSARAAKDAQRVEDAGEGEAFDPWKAAGRVLKPILRGDAPLIAGPWLSEVGYELLYWIPFLRSAVRRDLSLASRLVVVSRGGTEAWYDGIAGGGYIELFDHVTRDELVTEIERREADGEARKQMAGDAFDDRVLDRIEAARGLQGAKRLHPSVMFSLYWAIVKQEAIHRRRTIFTHEPLSRPAMPPQLESLLPEDFVAVRFYFNASFPATSENKAAVLQIVEGLLSSRPVVLLDPRSRYDDHAEFDLSELPGVYRIDEALAPATNLAVQSAALSRASAFVGTYGGLSYLGPLLGVPTVSLYSDPSRFRPHHLELAQRVFSGDEYGSFSALDVRNLDVLRLALGDRVAQNR